MHEHIITIDRMEHALNLFGSFDENVKMLEEKYGVSIVARGGDVKITGEEEQISKAVKCIEGLLTLINKGEQLNE